MVTESKDNLTIGEVLSLYQNHVYKKDITSNSTEQDKSLMVHDAGHALGEILTHAGHVLDFEYAKNNLPANRQAGYESEPIAVLYESFMQEYLKAHNEFNNPTKFVEEIIIVSEEINDSILSDDKEKLRNGEEIEPDRSKSHNEARKKYAENPESIIYPDEDEMLFHFHKAKELCDNIKKETGFYPSEILNNKSDLKFKDLPVSLFNIDNIYHPPEQSQKIDDSHVQRFKEKQKTEQSKPHSL